MDVIFSKFTDVISQKEIDHLDAVFVQHLRDIRQNHLLIQSKCKDPSNFTFYDRLNALKLKQTLNTTEDASLEQTIDKSLTYTTIPQAPVEEKKEAEKSYLHLFLTT